MSDTKTGQCISNAQKCISLEPCPFCGEIPELTDYQGAMPPLIECKNENCLVHPLASGRFADDTIEKLIADWNVRSNQETPND